MSLPPSVLGQVRQRGFRITAARRAIVELLASERRPMSADELLKSLVEHRTGVNKTTVYRELAFLSNTGFVQSVTLDDRRRRYEWISRHHHHVVCVRCRRVEDVRVEQDLRLEERRVARSTRFRILKHSLEFFGLCKTCQRTSTP